jgi:hypothetical protein
VLGVTAGAVGWVVCRPGGMMPVGAENLCHQAIFMNQAPCAVMLLDPELI